MKEKWPQGPFNKVLLSVVYKDRPVQINHKKNSTFDIIFWFILDTIFAFGYQLPILLNIMLPRSKPLHLCSQ